MFDIKKFFFPFNSFSTCILQTIEASEDSRLFFGDLWRSMSNLMGQEVPPGKLHHTLSRLVVEGFLSRKRWATSRGEGVEARNQYLLTYKGRDLLRGEFTFSLLHKYSKA